MTIKKATAPAVPAAEGSTPPVAGTTEQKGAPQSASEEPDGEEPPADTRTEREKELEAENQQLRDELDAEINAHNRTITQRDDLSRRLDEALHQPEQGTDLEESEEEEEEEEELADEEADVKALMRRNGLKKAWKLPSGICFDEKHARHVLGDAFEAHPVIEAE